MLQYDSLREQAVGSIPARVNFWTFLFTFVTVCYGLTLLSTCAKGLQFYCPSCNFIQKLSNFFARYASSEFIHDFDSFLYYVFSIYIYILAISLLPRAMILPFILDKDVETSTRYFNFKSVSIIYKAKKVSVQFIA